MQTLNPIFFHLHPQIKIYRPFLEMTHEQHFLVCELNKGRHCLKQQILGVVEPFLKLLVPISKNCSAVIAIDK